MKNQKDTKPESKQLNTKKIKSLEIDFENKGVELLEKGKSFLKAHDYIFTKEKLLGSVDYFKKALNDKPQSKISREGLMEAWECLSTLHPLSPKTHSSLNGKNGHHKGLSTNVLSKKLRNIFIDNLIEIEWKKQSHGKFGPSKPNTLSWKEFYLINEKELNELESITDKLCWAVEKGHEKLVQYYVENEKADVNIQNKNGDYILQVAIAKKYQLIFKVLLESGASVTNKSKKGWAAIHYAVKSQVLSIFDKVIEEGGDPKILDSEKNSTLHIAAFLGNLEISKKLISLGVNINSKNNGNITALHLAINHGGYMLASYLLENGASVVDKDKFDQTIIHWSVVSNSRTILKQVLEKTNEGINQIDVFGRSPLHWAAQKGDLDVVSLLVERGAKINIKDKYEQTALLIAAFYGHPSIVTYLFNRGGSID
ncbi:hypothetical protein HOG98_00435 [bacterium]|nr:hypothetical protein [bacterium]